MPHGFECDRCKQFVEFGNSHPNLGPEIHPETNEPLEVVKIDNPFSESDSGADYEEYTLCDTCRRELIHTVETFSDN